jgi:hypothetical protein
MRYQDRLDAELDAGVLRLYSDMNGQHYQGGGRSWSARNNGYPAFVFSDVHAISGAVGRCELCLSETKADMTVLKCNDAVTGPFDFSGEPLRLEGTPGARFCLQWRAKAGCNGQIIPVTLNLPVGLAEYAGFSPDGAEYILHASLGIKMAKPA